jgi:hypothetical protein
MMKSPIKENRMKCKTLYDLGCFPDDDFPEGVKPAGTIIDHPDAYRLVQLGVAEPADEECEQKHGMTHENMLAKQKTFPRIARGILPEDYEAFENGEMIGYDNQGRWVPGPNYCGSEQDYEDTAVETEEALWS